MPQKTMDYPDSPRSWAIAGAAFVINIMLSGISRTTGLYYVALIETYGVTRMEANMPFSLRNIVRNILGPVVGVMGHRYGSQGVTMSGGFIAALGICLCAVAPNVKWISVFWGVMHGVGVAFGNTLFQVVVSQYFEKHRATASGIAFSGGCVGSFVFPLILEYLLTNFGLSGTFLLTGALILHVVPAGILIKEPVWSNKVNLTEYKANRARESEDPVPNLKGACSESPKAVVIENESSKGANMDIFAISFRRISSSCDFELSKKENNTSNQVNNAKGLTFNSKTDKAQKNEHKNPKSLATSEETEISLKQGIIEMCCDPMFHMISVSLAAFVIPFDMALTVVVDYMKDKGIKQDTGKYFISIMSVGDFVGRLGFGWVTDRNYISVPKYMTLIHLVQGLSFAAIPFFQSYVALMTLVVVGGIAGGANIVMYPVLVTKYLPNVQSLGIGFISFTSGIIQFGIPSLIGVFRDTFGSYDGLYFIIGGLSCITAFLWTLEPLLLRLKSKITKISGK